MLGSIDAYKKVQDEFLRGETAYKEQCEVTQAKVEDYLSAQNDPSKLYNSKVQQVNWAKLTNECLRLVERETVYEEYLEVLETKKKALGINLEELLLRNKKTLERAVAAVLVFADKAATSYPLFFQSFVAILEKATFRVQGDRQE